MALIDVFFTKNPMLFTYSAPSDWATQDNYRFYFAVEIYNGSAWEVAMIQEQIPNALNQVKFDAKAAFRQAFLPVPPIPGAASIARCINNTCKIFRVKYGNLTGALTVPSSVTTVADYLAVLGGLSKQKFAELGHFFFSYLTAANPKKFMTWAPNEKYVDRNQEDFINFWLTSAPAGNELRLQVTAYYDDDTNETAITKIGPSLDFTNPNDRLWMIPSGPANSGAIGINGAKTLVKYTLRVLNGSNGVISEDRTYIVDPISYPHKRLVMFLNSLGTWEVLRMSGTSSAQERYERNPTRAYLAPGYSSTQGELKSNGAQGSYTINFSTGWLEGSLGKEWQLYMRDLMRSQAVYDITSASRVPLVITSDSYAGPEDRNYQYFVRFDAVQSFIDEVYTPESVQ